MIEQGTLLLAGGIVGFLSSFFGLGGGVIMVPTLYFLYPKLSHLTIVSTALGVIFLNGLANTFYFTRLKVFPSPKILLPLACCMGLGAWWGGAMATAWPPTLLKRLLAGVLLAMAIKLFFERPSPLRPSAEKRTHLPGSLILGLGTGLIEGLMGLGGGVFLVPGLALFHKLPFTLIPAYTNPVMCVGALSGMLSLSRGGMASIEGLPEFSGKFQWGVFNGALIGTFALTSLIAGFFGTKVGKKRDQTKMRKAFSALLLLFSGQLFFS